MPKPKMPEISENSTENLQNYLQELNTKKKELENIRKSVQEKLKSINELLPEQGKTWSEHCARYNAEFAQQLEKSHDIILTTEEKAELNNINPADIQAKLEKLQKLGIKVPENATTFTISTYDIVFAALSRSLQKPENLPKIIKSLPIIKEEEEAANKIRTQFEKPYQDIINTITNSKNQALAITGLSDEQLTDIEKLTETISKVPQAPASMPEAAEELKS